MQQQGGGHFTHFPHTRQLRARRWSCRRLWLIAPRIVSTRGGVVTCDLSAAALRHCSPRRGAPTARCCGVHRHSMGPCFWGQHSSATLVAVGTADFLAPHHGRHHGSSPAHQSSKPVRSCGMWRRQGGQTAASSLSRVTPVTRCEGCSVM